MDQTNKKKAQNEREKSTALYLKEITNIKPLSREEEFRLWKLYKDNNDLSARNKLVTANLKYVAKIASCYTGRGLSYSDLVGEGNIGLVKAIDKFDGTRGVKTLSYSIWWIKQAMLDAINNRNGVEHESLVENITTENYEDDEQLPFSNLSTINESIIEDNDADFKNHLNNDEIISLLSEALSEKEKDILFDYYGIGGSPMILEEIGTKYGISKERARQIIEKSLKKMRCSALSLNLSNIFK